MKYVGRFAPSPTGPLHIGSLATAIGSFLDARMHQGQWLVRIEDIDEGRCDPYWSNRIIATLREHGMISDAAPIIQTERYSAYEEALETLNALGLTYPCACTRREIELANQDRPVGQNRVYPGTCAKGMAVGKTARAIRFRCPCTPLAWHDLRLGAFDEDLQQTSGDFVLKRGDGFWAYHLAVVVDDMTSKVTHIVRGEDLADTTARQIALYKAFNKAVPEYWHLPVVLADDGQKLSKQTGARALPEDQAVTNLNQVWAHFGMDAIPAKSCHQWLEKALPFWANYRARAIRP